MFWNKSNEAHPLDQPIKVLEDEMTTKDGDSDEYATMLNRLERLYKLKEKHSKSGINPETYLIVGGNLAGILIIVFYEHAHTVTSRAIGFAGKLR